MADLTSIFLSCFEITVCQVRHLKWCSSPLYSLPKNTNIHSPKCMYKLAHTFKVREHTHASKIVKMDESLRKSPVWQGHLFTDSGLSSTRGTQLMTNNLYPPVNGVHMSLGLIKGKGGSSKMPISLTLTFPVSHSVPQTSLSKKSSRDHRLGRIQTL